MNGVAVRPFALQFLCSGETVNAVMAGRLFVVSEHCAPRPSVRRRGATSCAVTIAYRSDIHRVANPVIPSGRAWTRCGHDELIHSQLPIFRFCAWRPPIGGRGALDPLPLSRRSAARAIDNPSRALCP